MSRGERIDAPAHSQPDGQREGAGERVTEEIEIASIVRDVVVRAGAGVNRATVAEYAAAMQAIEEAVKKGKEAKPFPLPVCYRDRNVTRLADGAHRIEAAIALGATTVKVEIRVGGRKEALQYAVTSGRTHGLRFSTRDKQHQCEIFLKTYPNMKDRAIGRELGVDHKTVKAARDRLATRSQTRGEIPQSDPVAALLTRFAGMLDKVPTDRLAEFQAGVTEALNRAAGE